VTVLSFNLTVFSNSSRKLDYLKNVQSQLTIASPILMLYRCEKCGLTFVFFQAKSVKVPNSSPGNESIGRQSLPL